MNHSPLGSTERRRAATPRPLRPLSRCGLGVLLAVALVASSVHCTGRVSYRSAVLADRPTAYWRLGEQSGTAAARDATGTDKGNYLKGVTVGRVGAITGDPNTAAHFDGVNDTASIRSSANVTLSPELALETWVKPDGLPATTSMLMRKEGEYLLRLTRSGGVIFRVWVPTAPGGSWNLGTAPFVRSGYWNHVVATLNGTATAIYVNGVLRATGTLAGARAASTANPLFLASSAGENDYFKGTLDEVAVYHTAISADRVNAHFDAAVVPIPRPVVTLTTPAGRSTMDTSPAFGGHAAPGRSASVRVKVYAGRAASQTPVQTLTTRLEPAGTFSVVASKPLRSGTYSALAEQTVDSVVYRSKATTFIVDASTPPTLLAAGDIAGCDTFGDEATADILKRLPGIVVPVGDLAYEDGSASDFANCFDPTWGVQRARSRPAVGDHEYRTPGASAYFSYWGKAAGDPKKGYYSYDVGSWHVVTLNSACDKIGGCGAGSAQERWLRADLAAKAGRCTLAILHSPRFSSGAEHGDNASYQPFWQALEDYGVEAVIGGNDHLYERFASQDPDGTLDRAHGVRQFIVGTGGRSHYPFGTIRPNSQVRNNDTFGVLKLTLRIGSYRWQFMREAGKTFADSGSNACH